MDFEQMAIDVCLEGDRSLKDNVSKVIQFTYDKRIKDAERNGTPLTKVRNKHEGYGIAAEAWSKIQAREKDIKQGMGDYLGRLQVQGNGDALQSCGSLYDAALNLAIEAIGMAADMNRIMNDLYYSDTTPLDEYLDVDDSEEPTDDDFSEEFEDAALPEAREFPRTPVEAETIETIGN